MSTHYTPSSTPLVRLIHWRFMVFKFVIPIFLIISSISAFIDGVPYAYYVLTVAWLYTIGVVGVSLGVQRALQVHAGAASVLFFSSSIVSVFMSGSFASAVEMLIYSLVMGIIAGIIQFNFRLTRLESRGNSSRSADFPGIYRITCIPTGKHYIGQTSQAINARWAEHRSHLDGRYHHNRWLQADWELYRPEQFKWEVLEIVTDPVWLLDRERAWQDKDYDASKRYNPPNLAPRIAKANRRPHLKRKSHS